MGHIFGLYLDYVYSHLKKNKKWPRLFLNPPGANTDYNSPNEGSDVFWMLDGAEKQ